MNRRDVALFAHLDSTETRWTALFTQYHAEVMGELRAIRSDIGQLREDIAGVKLDLATHGPHGDEG